MSEPILYIDSSAIRQGQLERVKAAITELVEFVEANAIDVYGQPSEAVLKQLWQKAQMLGSGTVEVHCRQAGFAR